MKKDVKLNNVLKAFAKLNYQVAKNAEHITLINATGQKVFVPNHRTVKGSTLIGIAKNAGIDKNRLFNLL